MSENRVPFNFEIMDAAGYGYYRVWKERRYLAKIAAIPFFIKFASTIAILALNLDDNQLRQGLIMLPSMFAQGWVLAQFLRTLLMNEYWPMQLPLIPDETIINKLLNRARGIISSVLIYVLLGMLAYVMRYGLYEIMPSDEELDAARESVKAAEEAGQASGASGGNFLMTIATLVPTLMAIAAVIWLFRFMWLYIPFAVLYPVRDYLKNLAGFMSSVKLLLLFFSCMAPITFLAVFCARIVFSLTDGMGESGDAIANFITIFIGSVSEICVALVTTAAFAWAMRSFLPRKKETFLDFPELDSRK